MHNALRLYITGLGGEGAVVVKEVQLVLVVLWPTPGKQVRKLPTDEK